MDMFAKAFDHTLGIEGFDKYTNDPRDSGGPTRYGMTERVARAEGYTGDMRELPLAFVMAVARRKYWDRVAGDEVAVLSPNIACELFDTAYNMGPDRAAFMLQRALNCFNNSQRPNPPGPDYPDLRADGEIGPQTVSALRSYLKKRGAKGEAVMLECLNSQQCDGYLDIATARTKDEAFVYGQILQRVVKRLVV